MHRNREHNDTHHDNDSDAPRYQRLRDEELDPVLSEIGRKVISSAIEVHRTIGPGLDKSIYDNALAQELEALGARFTRNEELSINYKGRPIASQRVAFHIEGRYIVETMSSGQDVSGFQRDQFRTLLKATANDMGLILNFGHKRLTDGLVRVLNPERIDHIRGVGHAGAGMQA